MQLDASDNREDVRRDLRMAEKLESRTFTVKTVRDYQALTALLKEHKMPLISIKTDLDTDNKENIHITTQGSRCYLDFVQYLMVKQTKRTNEMLKKVRVK